MSESNKWWWISNINDDESCKDYRWNKWRVNEVVVETLTRLNEANDGISKFQNMMMQWWKSNDENNVCSNDEED